MNTETNELMALSKDQSKFLEGDIEGITEEKINEIAEELEGFEPVPQGLERAAKIKLAGRGKTQVSFTSGGKLSTWAAGQRKKKRRKIANASKKINRKKK